MEIYVVKEGDTVDVIAQTFAVSPQNIIANNQLTSPYPLAVGQALLIGEPELGTERIRDAGGYAYTYISPWVLRQTLPFSVWLEGNRCLADYALVLCHVVAGVGELRKFIICKKDTFQQLREEEKCATMKITKL